MTTVVDIYNLALSAVGARATVASTSETTREVEICNLWYAHARDAVLASAPWPSARFAAKLNLVKERDPDVVWVQGDPFPGWRFMYDTPVDLLRPRHISTYERFEYAVVGGARVIMTHVEDPILIYTRQQITIDLWDAELRLAIAYALAAHIAMPLQGKDKRALTMEQRANERIIMARQGAGESDVVLEDNLPDWFQARGYGFTAGPRYVYPYGPLISISEGISVS